MLGFQRLKVLLINHSLSSLCSLCCDKYAFFYFFLQLLNFSSLLLLYGVWINIFSHFYCLSMKIRLKPKYIEKQTIYPIVQSNLFLDCFIVQRIVCRTIFATNFSERTLSMCFNKKKTTQNIAMADWYFLHYMIYPKPSVESDLVEGWFTITKEKPYREGRSKRLLGCDLSFQKN